MRYDYDNEGGDVDELQNEAGPYCNLPLFMHRGDRVYRVLDAGQ